MEEQIQRVCGQIVSLVEPEKVILFNEKKGVGGQVSGFKLCVIVDDREPRRLEETIYMQVECGVTFDVLVYDKADWQRLLDEPGSFAGRIAGSGRVLYEQAR